MVTRPLNAYLWLALTIALVSVVVSAGILLVGLTPLGPLDPPTDGLAEHLSQVATLSAAVSGIFALMVGTIAILALIVAERAETKAIEQLSIDVSRLWMVLHTIRNRGLLYTSPDQVDPGVDLFENERHAILEVLNGPTGFSLYAWQADHQNRGFGDFTSDLAGLVNLMTLQRHSGPALFNAIMIRANKTADLLAHLSDRDVAQMAGVLRRLGSGLDRAQTISQEDKIGRFIRDFDQSRKEELAAPSVEEVEEYAQKAQRLIGGQGGETVRHFGNQAMSGDHEDIATWHKLIGQLGLAGDD